MEETVKYYCKKMERLKTENDNDFMPIDMSIDEFVLYIVTIFHLKKEDVKAAYYQIRYLLLTPESEYTDGNCHRLWLTSLLLIHKFVEDTPYTNRIWSHYSPFTINELNKMETQFLKCCDYKIVWNYMIREN